jgi:hypothetical protein
MNPGSLGRREEKRREEKRKSVLDTSDCSNCMMKS